jgi:hypothetical protein
VQDSIVVRLPDRQWALCAIDDLATEGCHARLLPERDADGLWQLHVSGPCELIDQIRFELHVPEVRVCWETFVNSAIGSLPESPAEGTHPD